MPLLQQVAFGFLLILWKQNYDIKQNNCFYIALGRLRKGHCWVTQAWEKSGLIISLNNVDSFKGAKRSQSLAFVFSKQILSYLNVMTQIKYLRLKIACRFMLFLLIHFFEITPGKIMGKQRKRVSIAKQDPISVKHCNVWCFQ